MVHRLTRISQLILRVYSEFNNAGCLLISEVKYLLENRDKDAPDTAYASCIISYRRSRI